MWGFIKKIFKSEEDKVEKIIKSAPDKSTLEERRERAFNIALKMQ